MNRDSRVDAAVWEQPNEHEVSVFRFIFGARFNQIPIQELSSLSRAMTFSHPSLLGSSRNSILEKQAWKS